MRVLIADKSSAARSALRMLVGEEPDLQVVGEAGDAEQLLDQLAATQPDLLLLDWELAGNPAALPMLSSAELREQPKSIVLCGRPEVEAAALAAGADVFFSKGDQPRRLLALIRSLRLEEWAE